MRYLLLLVVASLSFAQFDSSGPAGATVVQIQPSGGCVSATAKARIYQGTIYTCHNNAWAAVGSYALPIATTSTLGGIKPDGTTITVNGATGVASSAGWFDVVSTFIGKPTAGALIYALSVAHPASFAANFSGSSATCGSGANPTSTAVYTMTKNGTSVGTVSLSSSCVATWATSGGAVINFVKDDRLEITAPNPQDATAANIALTFVGTR